MDLGLKGRTAIVCGASAGIGLGIAEALAEEGANVAMFARRRDVLEREAERSAPSRSAATSPSPRPREAVEKTLGAFGGYDVVV